MIAVMTIPQILLGVAYLLVEGGVRDIDVIQAALLHDTVEDTDTTNEELVQEFGPEVAGIVAEVSAGHIPPHPPTRKK